MLNLLLHLFFITPPLHCQSEIGPGGCYNYGICAEGYDLTTKTCTGYCACNAGSTGKLCETKIIENCSPSPCPSPYTCMDHGFYADCSCPAGTTGDNCEYPLSSPCLAKPCLNGGTCVDRGTAFTCLCPAGKAGEFCGASDTCTPQYCAAGGTCRSDPSGTQNLCDCPTTTIGRKCNNTKASIDGVCYKNFALSPPLTDAVSGNFALSQTASCRAFAVTNNMQQAYFFANGACLASNISASGAYSTSLCLKPSNALNNTENFVFRMNTNGSGFYCTPMDCGENLKQGACFNAIGGPSCICSPNFKGSSCESVAVPNPCASSPCSPNGHCTPTSELFASAGIKCTCDRGYSGALCNVPDACQSSPCQNGGQCVAQTNGTYSCQCPSLYDLDVNCALFSLCPAIICENGGICTEDYMGTAACNCAPGWMGANCEKVLNMCDPMPCLYGDCFTVGSDFACTCTTGWTRRRCDADVDECSTPFARAGGTTSSNRCTAFDSEAGCANIDGSFTCTCGSGYTGKYCAITVAQMKMVMTLLGTSNESEVDVFMAEAHSNPAILVAKIPALMAGVSEEVQSGAGFDVDDIFDWAAFERKTLDLYADLTKWFDAALGNCFTFNHRNSALVHGEEMVGERGSLRVLLNAQSNESMPWEESSTISVYIHMREEDVFYETASYNPEPFSETLIAVYSTQYNRLGHPYGGCARDSSRSGRNYYPGAYATESCLRSCYQDVVVEECGCYDAHYAPVPEKTPCNVSAVLCTMQVLKERGDDLSAWTECDCPRACHYQDFTVNYSKAPLSMNICNLANLTLKVECLKEASGKMLLTVLLPYMGIESFDETPALTFTKCLSFIGGILGLIIGASFISFIEFIPLFISLFRR